MLPVITILGGLIGSIHCFIIYYSSDLIQLN